MMNSTPIDRISNLPDELLCHILSFLPTKLAVTTAVLSKRWTPLFKLLTTLHFDDESFSNKQAFPCIVERVILSTEVIKTFHLNCHAKHRNRFNHWINTAKLHPLENLELGGKSHDIGTILCQSIFIFPTLVVLKLTRLTLVDDISVDLPSLKTLHLNYVFFENQTRDNFNKLLNGCPVLEDLQTGDIFYLEQGDLGDSGVRLKTLSNLTRANISAFDVPIKAIHNVHFLQLKIWDKHLEQDIKSYYRDFLVLQNLIHLELSFYNINHWNDDVVKVLENCSRLQILTITKWSDLYNEDLDRNWINPNIVPKCISSNLRSCTFNYEGFKDEIQFATYILKNALLLRIMKITVHKVWINRDALNELKSCPRISSECELSISFTVS